MKRFILPFLLVLFSSFVLEAGDTQSLLDLCMNQIRAVKRFDFVIRSTERFGNGYKSNAAFIKCQLSPLKIYVKTVEGNNLGSELLYVDGWNGNKAMVNPGKFLPNMSFQILSNTMHEDHHYSLYEVGFGVTQNILNSLLSSGKLRKNVSVLNEGTVSWKDMKFTKCSFTDSSFGWQSYTPAAGETAYQISKKKSLSEYLIMEKNKLKNFNEDLGGKSLQIPTSYCRKAILYFSNSLYLPQYIELYDDAGMFEKYETTELHLNPTFAEDEFSTDNPAYGF